MTTQQTGAFLRAVIRVIRVIMVIAVVSGAAGLTGCSGNAIDPRCLRTGSTSVGAYEWREVAWRKVETYGSTLDQLEAACVTQLYVDITGAGPVMTAADAAPATSGGSEPTSGALNALDRDLAALITAAGSHSIAIHAVAGDPGWISDHEGAQAIIRYVAHFNGSRSEPIGSVQFDVEPWADAEWSSRRNEMTTRYLELIRALTISPSPSIRAGFVIPYWFDGTGDAVERIAFEDSTEYPLAHVMTMVNRSGSFVTVMAYRNHAFGEGGADTLLDDEFAAAPGGSMPGGSVFVAQETAEINEKTATYFGVEPTTFVGDMRKLSKSLSGRPGFGGLIVNDVPSVLKLIAPLSDHLSGP